MDKIAAIRSSVNEIKDHKPSQLDYEQQEQSLHVVSRVLGAVAHVVTDVYA